MVVGMMIGDKGVQGTSKKLGSWSVAEDYGCGRSR